MADTKISALPTAGTLTGAEIVPIVQAGVTVQVTLNALKAWLIAGPATEPTTTGSLNFSSPDGTGLGIATVL